MDANRLKEITKPILYTGGKYTNLKLPYYHGIEMSPKDFHKMTLIVNEDIKFYPLKNNKEEVCDENDLHKMLNLLNLNISYIDFLRIYIKNTKKWGAKPLFKEAANSTCFLYDYEIIDDKGILLLFNVDGTRNIESVYFHGVWEIDFFGK